MKPISDQKLKQLSNTERSFAVLCAFASYQLTPEQSAILQYARPNNCELQYALYRNGHFPATCPINDPYIDKIKALPLDQKVERLSAYNYRAEFFRCIDADTIDDALIAFNTTCNYLSLAGIVARADLNEKAVLEIKRSSTFSIKPFSATAERAFKVHPNWEDFSDAFHLEYTLLG